MAIYLTLPAFAQEGDKPKAFVKPKIVVSLLPIHSLMAGIMDGVGKPELLLDNEASPHHFMLKPSEAQKLSEARLVVVTSLSAEHYIKKILEEKSHAKSKVIEVLNIPGLTLQPSIEPETGKANPNALPDMHVWMDPLNAVAITQYFTELLIEVMPEHAAIFRKNATKQIENLQKLHKENEAIFKPYGKERKAAYASHHNMLRYFEGRYNITGGLALTYIPEHGLKPEDVARVENAAKEGKLKCALSEKHFSAKTLQQLADKYKLEMRAVDPLGSAHPKGKALYFNLMRDITRTVSDCLKSLDIPKATDLNIKMKQAPKTP